MEESMQSTSPIWFDSFTRLGEIAIASVFFWLLIIVLIRLSGKRTTSQMNNFDWIITVAVGSLAASGILLEDVTIADATAAIVMLGLLQFALTWLVVRSDRLTKVVKAEPTLLTHKGEYLKDAMLRERITKSEVDAALRENGIAEPEGAQWVVLETDGTLSVIPKQDSGWDDAATLEGVNAPGRIA